LQIQSRPQSRLSCVQSHHSSNRHAEFILPVFLFPRALTFR